MTLTHNALTSASLRILRADQPTYSIVVRSVKYSICKDVVQKIRNPIRNILYNRLLARIMYRSDYEA